MARILVVDDDDQIRSLLRRMLQKFGHDVIDAVDGKDALEKYTLNPTDLVITDILMPEKEGIQTIMELRRDFPDAKIIAISGGGAVGPETYLTMARELGADRTLTKPFTIEALQEIVNELI